MQDISTAGSDQGGFKEVKSKKKKRDPKSPPSGTPPSPSPTKPPDESTAPKDSSGDYSPPLDVPDAQKLDKNVTTTRGSSDLFSRPFGSEQSFGTPTSQDVVSFRTDSQVKSSRKTANQAAFAEATNIDLNDDPRELILDVIEEAYVNLGGRTKVFELHEKLMVLRMLAEFGMTTWSSIFEKMMSRHAMATYSARVDSFLNDLFVYKDPNHPVKGIISCFLFYAPNLLMRHAMALANKETTLGLLHFRLFGSKEFQGIWTRWLLREKLPMSQAECHKVFFVKDLFATGNFIKGSFMTDLIDNWEDDEASDIIMIPDPKDYAPEDYSPVTTTNVDTSTDQQENPTVQTEDVNTTNDDNPINVDAVDDDTPPESTGSLLQQAPDLAFPTKAPINGRTHLHGYWAAQGPMEIWRSYHPPLLLGQLPSNLKWKDEHWIGRLFPGGKTAYAGPNSDGTRRFIYAGDKEFDDMFPTTTSPVPPTHTTSTATTDPNASVAPATNATTAIDTPTAVDQAKGLQIRHWTQASGAGSGLKQSNPTRISWGLPTQQHHQTQPTPSNPMKPTPITKGRPSLGKFFPATVNLSTQGIGFGTSWPHHGSTPKAGGNHSGSSGPTGGNTGPTGGNPGPNRPHGGGSGGTNVGGSSGPTPPTGSGGAGFPPSGGPPGPGGGTPSGPSHSFGSGGGGFPPPYGSVASMPRPPPKKPKWVYKPDLNAYTEYKTPETFSTWVEDTFYTMLAQGLGNIADPDYVPDPMDNDEVEEFVRQQRFTFMMLSKKVLEPVAKRIIRNHKHTMDAQEALVALCNQAQSSTQAVLTRRRNLEILTKRRYDPKDNKTASMFILEYETMVEEYNDQQNEPGMILNGNMKKAMLQASLSPVMMLRAVADRETERMVQGGMAFTFEEYLAAVKASAALYDEGRMGRRSVHTINNANIDEPTDPVNNEIMAYLISKRNRRNPGATMNKETWTGLSDQGKATWDKMSDQDKRMILQYVSKRGEKPNASAAVNFMEMDSEVEQVQENDMQTEGAETMTVNVHDATSQARDNAHPGDPRRMMGSQRHTNQVTQVKFTNWGNDMDVDEEDLNHFVDAYWESDDNDSDSDFQ